MNLHFSLFLLLGCVCATTVHLPLAHAQDDAPTAATPAVVAVGATLTAAQIIEKSRQTYAAFSVYEGSCSVVSDASITVGDGAPTQNVSSASAKIEFVRDKYLSVEGVDAGGSPFKALWTPGEAYIEQVRRGATIAAAGKIARSDYKDEATLSASDSMIAGLTGFTGEAGSTIPAALQNDSWSNPFPLEKSQLELLPSRDLGTVACYVVQATMSKLNRVRTYYIEQKTFLLRRMTEDSGEQIFDDLPKRNGVEQPVMRVAYSRNQFVFATTEAK